MLALSPAERERICDVCADVASDVAVLLRAAGRRDEADRLLRRAVETAISMPALDLLRAAQAEFDAYADLVRGMWLTRTKRFGEAEALLRGVQKKVKAPVLRGLAKQWLDAPRPITSAPSLFTLNGFGVTLYGERDRSPDGSYTATTYLAALFIPVLPLASYRVVKRDGRSYGFIGKVPLGPVARWWQRGLLAAGLLGLGGFGVESWRTSPSHRLEVAVGEASALEKKGEVDPAAQAYDAALRTFEGSVPAEALRPAALGWTRLRVGAVHEPFERGELDQVERLVRRFQQMPAPARDGEPSALLVQHLEGWDKQLGSGTLEVQEASLRLAELERTAAAGPAVAEATARRDARQLALAASLAPEWPLEALELDTALATPEATRAAAALLASFGPAGSLHVEAQPSIQRWLPRALALPDLAAAAKDLGQRLDEATTQQALEGRVAALKSDDPAQLKAALLLWPHDQVLASALASLQRQAGDRAGARATLAAQGPERLLVPQAQLVAARLALDDDQLDAAERLLKRPVSRRMKVFQAARQAYDDALKAAEARVVADARAGHLPRDVEQQLQQEHDEAAQREIFQKHLVAQLRGDARLAQLRAAYEAQSDVVGAALLLGTVQLRKASAAQGEARQALLADAEHAFLSIREEAQDSPAYRLGLGQVYHRLGKVAEGEAELQKLLDSGDALMKLQVSNAYRELGLVGRAQALGEEVLQSSDLQLRTAAARMLSAMSNRPEDQERWLARADPHSPGIKLALDRARAMRLVQEGKLKEADAMWGQVAEAFDRMAADSPSAANNAATSWTARFACTGDPRWLERATTSLESALRRQPDDPIVLENLASLLDERADLAVLGKRVHLDRLHLDSQEISQVLKVLLFGSGAAELVAELKTQPLALRGDELTAHVQVLAPNWPDPYEREAGRRWSVGDAPALRAVLQRMAARPLDRSEEEEARRRHREGTEDARLLKQADAALQRLDALSPAVEKDGHGPTRAAYLLTRASKLEDRVLVSEREEDAQARLDAIQQAEQAWPACGATRLLPDAALDVAAISVRKQVKRLDEAWRKDRREVGQTALLYREAAANAEVKEALARHPAVVLAGASLRAGMVRPEGDAWLVAWLLGDERLLLALRDAFATDMGRAEVDMSEQLAVKGPGLDAAKVLHQAMRR